MVSSALCGLVCYLETTAHDDSFESTCVLLLERAGVTFLQMGKIEISILREKYMEGGIFMLSCLVKNAKNAA
jgi:hypothetical protein